MAGEESAPQSAETQAPAARHLFFSWGGRSRAPPYGVLVQRGGYFHPPLFHTEYPRSWPVLASANRRDWFVRNSNFLQKFPFVPKRWNCFKNHCARPILKRRLPVLNIPWNPKDSQGWAPGNPLRNPWESQGILGWWGLGEENILSKDGLESRWRAFLSSRLTF